MSIEQAIHDRWEANAALVELVPADRVYTGRVPADSKGLPAVGLEMIGDVEVQCTSSQTMLRQIAFTFGVRVAQGNAKAANGGLEQGKRIARAIESAFKAAEFHYDGGFVQHMKPGGLRQEQHEQGGWTVFCDFMVRAEELTAA